jgi:hypothetical protein
MAYLLTYCLLFDFRHQPDTSPFPPHTTNQGLTDLISCNLETIFSLRRFADDAKPNFGAYL